MTKPIKHNNCSTGCHGSCCLKVQDLTVIRGDDAILDHVNFHMHCGELIALIGPNGAGKSSLFKSILGQMSGASGSISFQTATGEHLKPRIGYVPQSPSFDPRRPGQRAGSVRRLPSPAGRSFCLSPTKLRGKVPEPAWSGSTPKALIDKRVGALSGGELQRVLLAMALEPLPHILILDEPMSGVDVEAGERQLLDMLDEIRTNYDLSILLSTHDFATLSQCADKVDSAARTRCYGPGPPAEVLASPEFPQACSSRTTERRCALMEFWYSLVALLPFEWAQSGSLLLYEKRAAGHSGHLPAVRPALHHGGAPAE